MFNEGFQEEPSRYNFPSMSMSSSWNDCVKTKDSIIRLKASGTFWIIKFAIALIRSMIMVFLIAHGVAYLQMQVPDTANAR